MIGCQKLINCIVRIVSEFDFLIDMFTMKLCSMNQRKQIDAKKSIQSKSFQSNFVRFRIKITRNVSNQVDSVDFRIVSGAPHEFIWPQREFAAADIVAIGHSLFHSWHRFAFVYFCVHFSHSRTFHREHSIEIAVDNIDCADDGCSDS